MLHWDEMAKNYGKGQIINLAKSKAKELKEDYQDAFNSIIWGTDTTSVAPLAQIVDASDSYAGIDPADASTWASHEDSSTTTLTLEALMHARNEATFGKHKPTHHFTTLDLVSKYERLMEPKEVILSKDMKNLGFDEIITFYGKPVIGVDGISTGDWFGLDMDVFELWVHEKYNLNVTEWFNLKQAGYPNAEAKYMSSAANLVCRMRRSSFKFTALVYTE
jgi:hypothetical protein